MDLKNKKLLYILSGIGILIVILLLVIVMQNHNNNPEVQEEKSSSISVSSSEDIDSEQTSMSESIKNKKDKLYKSNKFNNISGNVILDLDNGVAYKTSWNKDQYDEYVQKFDSTIHALANDTNTENESTMKILDDNGSPKDVSFKTNLGTNQNFENAKDLNFVGYPEDTYFKSAKDAYDHTVSVHFGSVDGKVLHPLLKEVK